MADSILRRILGRQGVTPTPEVEAALTELERLRTERPSLAEPASFLAAVLPGLFAGPLRERPAVLAPEAVTAKLAGNMPLLRGERLELDVPGFRQRWRSICAALPQGRDAAGIAALAEVPDRVDPAELLADVLAGEAARLHARFDPLGLDPGRTTTVLRLALYPALARVEAVLLPLRKGRAWTPGYCPTCGGWPLLGEFRGLEQTRFLRCGLCSAEWEFPRLQCPFCGVHDHHQLGYFHVEQEEGRYRAAACESCRGYVKMVTTLLPLSPPQLLVADVATLHLDLAAAERGFLPPP